MFIERIHRPHVVAMNDEDKTEMLSPGYGWAIFAESETESSDLWNFIAGFYEDEPESL